MYTDKRHLVIESAIALLAITLWRTTLSLLGVSSAVFAGFKMEAGSFMVLLGCFALARFVVSLIALFFPAKSASPATGVIPKAPADAGYAPRSALFRRSSTGSRLER